MPESAKLNILIETGADFVLPYTIYDNNGNPLDLTGATVESNLRQSAEASDFYEFACMHNGSGGRITITMPHETTTQITFSSGVYDVKVTLDDGTISYPLSGDVKIRQGVTKSTDGSVLFMLGINSFEDLPEVGNVDRLYFVYSDRKIYRWNGTNYVATSVGNGIQSIDFVEHVDDFSDKYRIAYDDGTHFDYIVTSKGIDYIEKVGSTGTVRTGIIDQYRIHFNNDTTHDYYVTNGRAFDVKTSYDATQAYEYLDMVKVDGATYVAVQDVPANTAITNTDYWLKIIAPLTMGTVTTVGAQELADASIGGTADAPVLNLTIPRGVTGNESIDDTKGSGDTDYVWSADKGWGLNDYYQNQDNLDKKLVDYKPNIYFHRNTDVYAPEITVINKQITLDGVLDNGSRNGRLCLSSKFYSTNDTTIDNITTSITLEEGVEYVVITRYVSGTRNDSPLCPAVSVYNVGTHTTLGSVIVSDNYQAVRKFTAGSSNLNLFLYIARQSSWTNYTVIVELMKYVDYIEMTFDKHSIIPMFNPSLSYKENDSVCYQGVNYRIVRDRPAGAWDGTGVEQTNYSYDIKKRLDALNKMLCTEHNAIDIGNSMIEIAEGEWAPNIIKTGNVIYLNGKMSTTGNRTGRLLLNSGNFYSTSNDTVDAIPYSIALEQGTEYVLISKYVSGSRTTPTCASVAVFKTGTHSSIGTVIAQDHDKCVRHFTVDNDPINLFLLVAKEDFYDYMVIVELKKYTDYLAETDPNNIRVAIADYYQTEMEDTIAKVKAVNTEPSLIFPWMTDIHRYSSGVPQTFDRMIENIKYFNSQVKCDFVLNTGDMIDGNKVQDTSLTEIDNCITQFNSLGIPYFWSQGNHDDNSYYSSGAAVFTIQQIYSALFNNVQNVNVNYGENGTDYYIDFSIGVRLISLNSCNVKLSNDYAFGNSTAAWLADALNTDRKVILAEHVTTISSQVYKNNKPINRDAITAAINAFIGNGGSYIQLNGHNHVDLAFISPWLSIAQVSQKFGHIDNPEESETLGVISGYIDEMVSPERTEGTATEDAWSVCVYKPFSNEFDMIRFGGGTDKYFHVSPIAPTTVTTQLTDTVTWSSSDTSVATVSDGVITGVGTGKCAILAKDDTGNYECWIVEN